MTAQFHSLPLSIKRDLLALPGPILILGAGGFIGFNLLLSILEIRKDCYGVFRSPQSNWRLKKNRIPKEHILTSNILDKNKVQKLFSKIKPKTVFNLAAYGAYSSQQSISEMYSTNVMSLLNILEQVKLYKVRAYVQTGSSSEYGMNSKGPLETGYLDVNSHYAVSKAASGLLLSYYQKKEQLPAIHLRLYSVYGPWEEPTRLIPILIQKARNKHFPVFAQKSSAHDFVYVMDVVTALILAAKTCQQKKSTNTFNIGTGKSTSLLQLATQTSRLFHITEKPKFSNKMSRAWDLTSWYANPKLAQKVLRWKATTPLTQGLENVSNWQKQVEYDTWNKL